MVGTLLLIMVLDKLRVYEKIKAWKTKEMPHRRSTDSEGDTHFHKRDESRQRAADLALAKANDIERRLGAAESSIAGINTTLNTQMDRDSIKEIRLVKLEAEQGYTKEKIRDIMATFDKYEETQKAAFSLISGLKDRLIKD